MLNVNCSNLKALLEELDKMTDELENDELNLFQNLHNSCISWHDGNSIIFNEYIEEEKKETESFFELIVNRKNVLREILNIYIQIGHKIRCNMNTYSKNSAKVKNCISQCESIMNTLNSISYDVSGIRNALSSVRSNLMTIDENITKKYKYVSEAEKKIQASIKNISSLVVSDYHYQLTNTKYDNRSTLDVDNIDKDMRQINLYSEEERKDLDKEFAKLFECIPEYNSNNTSELSNTIFELKTTSNYMTGKREKYVSTLIRAKENYQTATDAVVNIMNRDV